MTQVCLVGDPEVNLTYELLSRETARDALATYDIREPFENTVAVDTVSIGAAVSLLNDLDWYLVRFARDAFVLEPSVSESEWLSRSLATAVRDDEVDPEASDRFLKIYGVVDPAAAGGPEDDSGPPPGYGEERSDDAGENADEDANENADQPAGDQVGDASDDQPTTEQAPELVEPMYVTRTGPDLPAYDLRDVADTLLVRVTEDEFGGERQR
jgi:hypothetical protein